MPFKIVTFMGLLTETEFFKKHAAKYRGLSRAEKQRRYESYVRSETAQQDDDGELHHGRHRSRHVVGVRKDEHLVKTLLEEDERERHLREYLEKNEYYMQLINPFDNPPSEYPLADLKPYGKFQSNFDEDIFTNANGEAFIVFRPSVQASYCVTNQTETIATGNDISVAPYDNACALWDAYNASNNAGNTLNLGTFTRQAWSITRLLDNPDAAKIIATYTDVIPTGWGISFDYEASNFLAAGKATVVNMKGSYGLPYFMNAAYNMDRNIGEVREFGRVIPHLQPAGEESKGPTPASIQQIEGARIVRAKDGFTITGCPEGIEAATALRPMRYNPFSNTQAFEQRSGTTSTNNELVMPPACCGDPDDFRAFCNWLYSMNKAVSNSATGESLLFVSPNATAIADQCDGYMKTFQYTNMMDGDSYIMVAISGCPPNTMIGNVRFVANFVGIVDSRNFVPGEHKAKIGRTRDKVEIGMHAAAAAPQIIARPTSHDEYGVSAAGGEVVNGAEMLQEGHLEKASKSISETVGDVAGTIGTVAETVAEVAPVVEEVLGVLGSIFL